MDALLSGRTLSSVRPTYVFWRTFKPVRSTCKCLVAALVFLLIADTRVIRAQLQPADAERLSKYSSFWEPPDRPATALAPERQREIADASARARSEFAGKGGDVARHFLLHTDISVRHEAYWFVLGVVGDDEAATILVRALVQPPDIQSGILPRDHGQISIALETMLANPTIADSPTVAGELVKVAEMRSPNPWPRSLALQLLGKSRADAARAALNRLLVDPSPEVRGLAAKALGERATRAGAPPSESVAALIRILERDEDPQARIEAASALGRIGGAEAAAALSTAVERERSPRVVDAMASALATLGAPITDPQTCRSLVERAADPSVARDCFERWRASVERQAVVDAALTGGPVLRILAIEDLLGRTRRQEFIIQRRPARPPVIEPELQVQLLGSLASLLSLRSEPASIVPYLAQQVLWEVSGHDMPTALRYADAISAPDARFATSAELARKDAEAYAAVRRPTQLICGLAIVVLGALLAIYRPARRAAVPIMISAAVWAFWTSRATSMRSLPPPALMFLTVSAIGLLTAGVIAGIISALMARRSQSGVLLSIAAVIGGSICAGMTALILCGWSRSTKVFPTGGEGLQTVFESLGAAIIAGGWAFLLLLGDRLMSRRQSFSTSLTGPHPST